MTGTVSRVGRVAKQETREVLPRPLGCRLCFRLTMAVVVVVLVEVVMVAVVARTALLLAGSGTYGGGKPRACATPMFYQHT